MKALGDLLAKYQNLKPTDSIKKEAVIEVIDRLFDLKLEKMEISLVNNVAYLKTSTKLKCEVLLHKTEILKRLGEILAKEAPRDIR